MVALAGLVLLTVAVVLVLRHRRSKKARFEELSETQRRTLEEFEAQVLALLAQHGGELSQVRIAAALGFPMGTIEHDSGVETAWVR